MELLIFLNCLSTGAFIYLSFKNIDLRSDVRMLNLDVTSLKIQNSSLEAQNSGLRVQLSQARMSAQRYMLRNLEAKALEPQMVKRLVMLCHPDKHDNSKTSTEVTQWLLAQR